MPTYHAEPRKVKVKDNESEYCVIKNNTFTPNKFSGVILLPSSSVARLFSF